MQRLVPDVSWVIYQLVVKGEVTGPDTICRQTEWDEMERLRPGAQWLVQGEIASESQAKSQVRNATG
jgi:hypothetical protein